MISALRVSWSYLSPFVPDEFIAENIICAPIRELSDSLCERLLEEYDIDAENYDFIIAERNQDVVLDFRTVESLKEQLELSRQYLPQSLAISNDVLVAQLRRASNDG